MKDLNEAMNHAAIKYGNISVTNQLNQNVAETIDALLKPEQTPEQIEPKLLVKKKKKRRLHL